MCGNTCTILLSPRFLQKYNSVQCNFIQHWTEPIKHLLDVSTPTYTCITRQLHTYHLRT